MASIMIQMMDRRPGNYVHRWQTFLSQLTESTLLQSFTSNDENRIKILSFIVGSS